MLEELSKYFHMPVQAVAKELGISLASHRKLRLSYGITRWPFRKLKSIQRTARKAQRGEGVDGVGAGGGAVKEGPAPDDELKALGKRKRPLSEGAGEAAEERPHRAAGGVGGEKPKHKRQKVTKHKQQGFQGKGKGEVLEKRKRPSSEGAGTVGKTQGGQRVGGEGSGGGAVKKGPAKCPHNHRRSRCKQCGGAGNCEHNRRRMECKQCGGSSICEHNRIRSQCKQCGGAHICEHNRQRSKCRSKCVQCGGSSICEHNRRRSHARIADRSRTNRATYVETRLVFDRTCDAEDSRVQVAYKSYMKALDSSKRPTRHSKLSRASP